jgi:hypothetical protein
MAPTARPCTSPACWQRIWRDGRRAALAGFQHWILAMIAPFSHGCFLTLSETSH